MIEYYIGIGGIVIWTMLLILSIGKGEEDTGRFAWLHSLGFALLRLMGNGKGSDRWEREKYLAKGRAIAWTVTLLPPAFILAGAMDGGMSGMIFILAACMPALYILDDVRDQQKKLLCVSSEMFPRAVTKIALLVKAGMSVGEAWRAVAEGEEGVLYEEMRMVGRKTAVGVPETRAYREFTRECGIPAAERLVTAISRNKELGDRGLADVLQELSRELWQERVLRAREEGAKKANRLLIPSVMLFISILILVAAPMLLGLGGGG